MQMPLGINRKIRHVQFDLTFGLGRGFNRALEIFLSSMSPGEFL